MFRPKYYCMWCPFPNDECPKKSSQLGGSFPDHEALKNCARHHGRASTYHSITDEEELELYVDTVIVEEKDWAEDRGDFEECLG